MKHLVAMEPLLPSFPSMHHLPGPTPELLWATPVTWISYYGMWRTEPGRYLVDAGCDDERELRRRLSELLFLVSFLVSFLFPSSPPPTPLWLFSSFLISD